MLASFYFGIQTGNSFVLGGVQLCERRSALYTAAIAAIAAIVRHVLAPPH
jgi:hypothetical protein